MKIHGSLNIIELVTYSCIHVFKQYAQKKGHIVRDYYIS